MTFKMFVFSLLIGATAGATAIVGAASAQDVADGREAWRQEMAQNSGIFLRLDARSVRRYALTQLLMRK